MEKMTHARSTKKRTPDEWCVTASPSGAALSDGAERILHSIRLFQLLVALAALVIAISFLVLMPSLVRPEAASSSRPTVAVSAALALGAIIFFLAGITRLVIVPLRGLVEKTEETGRSKSRFLDRMCHQMRGPMNDIIGFCELAGREENNPAARGHITGIKNAGVNLLAIINEIIDYTKIEAGALDIIEYDYELAAIIESAIAVTRQRIEEKPLLFTISVESALPSRLHGDEIRVKEVLIHLLSNAVKFTHQGKISLAISGVREEGSDTVLLVIRVSDTGAGIQEEEMSAIFCEEGADTLCRYYGTSGAGIGLSIARSVCRLLGGDIHVDSIYGEGSVFVATLRQKIVDEKPLAKIERAEVKTVLLYEPAPEYAQSLEYILKDLNVPVTRIGDPSLFESALTEDRTAYTFFPAVLLRRVTELHEARGLKSIPVAIADGYSPPPADPMMAVIPAPAWTVPVAQILNGAGILPKPRPLASWTAPSAKILVVDDTVTSLKVAKGLLLPYKCEVDLCMKGKQALEIIKEQDYDLVFMDHLMPEMDGIETAAKIRELDVDYVRKMPIIALTGNVAAGMREMFLENGMNDFLTKPIDVARLNMILEKWIPDDKKVKQ
jgi:signal transduction histidine kinase/CheY-like chemotaxis protein